MNAEIDNLLEVKTFKEMFSAIHIVKLSAWEDKFAGKIHKLRATELERVKRYLYLGALNIFVLWRLLWPCWRFLLLSTQL